MKIIMDPRRFVAIALGATLTAGCSGTLVQPPKVAPEPHVVLIEDRDAEFLQTCTDVFVDELGRDRAQPWGPADGGREACLDRCRRGETKEQLVAWVRSTPEYAERQARLAREAREAEERRRREEDDRERNRSKLRGRLRVDGRVFVDASGRPFRPVFTSALAILSRTPSERDAFLEWAATSGFNGIRVFAGALTGEWWTAQLGAPQAADAARAALPGLLEAAAARGLYVEVTAITDSKDGGYDIAEHLAAVRAIVERYDHTILEVANEFYHGTQRDDVQDASALYAMARRALDGTVVAWALGAPPFDEPQKLDPMCAGDTCAIHWPTPVGTFVTSHLDRGRDKWNQVRRVRELFAIYEHVRVAVLNNEPIGAAEADDPGRRLADPSFFFALGVLNRFFEIGGVFHSSDGLVAKVPGPIQQACARAFVEGSRIVDVDTVFAYRNARWPDSPVADARFVEQGGPIVRAYSFLDGNVGYVVVLTDRDVDPLPALTIGNGWRLAGMAASRPNVTVYRVER